MKRLTIITGTLGAAEAAFRPGWGARIVKMPELEGGDYERFIRRTNVLKEVATSGVPTVLVEPRHLQMDVARSRMLARVAMGLGAAVQGCQWCGLGIGEGTPNEGPGIGNWGAKVLVVGDAPNWRAPEGTPNWPFISSAEYGCAAWLADRLEAEGVSEESLYWINASSRRGGERVATVAEACLERRWAAVVTLGRPAALWARSVGLEGIHEGFHPSFWWTKRSAQPYTAARFLGQAARSAGGSAYHESQR